MTRLNGDDLGRAAAALMARREREYHYAAYDLLAQFIDAADEQFLRRWVTQLLTTTPWWDTVDGIGTAAVSPLCRRFDSAATIDEWSESGDRWLVRAAIQHQRGWRRSTDVERVLGLCHRHWAEREFFIAKAIGWALRDITRLDPDAVLRFLTDHRGSPTSRRYASHDGWFAAPTPQAADLFSVPFGWPIDADLLADLVSARLTELTAE